MMCKVRLRVRCEDDLPSMSASVQGHPCRQGLGRAGLGELWVASKAEAVLWVFVWVFKSTSKMRPCNHYRQQRSWWTEPEHELQRGAANHDRPAAMGAPAICSAAVLPT